MMNAIYVCQHFVIKSDGLSSDSTYDGQSTQQTNKTFPTLLKLISGALIGDVNSLSAKSVLAGEKLVAMYSGMLTTKKYTLTLTLMKKPTLQSQPITWVWTKIQIYTKYQPCLKQLEKWPD
jgi:hypothetical protein